MGNLNHEAWRTVIEAALSQATARKEGAIPAARFKYFFEVEATRNGLQFPPAEQPEVKFVTFLEDFPDVVTVHRRTGIDALLVPPANPELLADAPGPMLQVRDDLFDAFIRIRNHQRAWYDKAHDTIVWHQIGETPSDPELCEIPPATQESEQAIRVNFAHTISDPTHAELLDALKEPSALAAFGSVVRRARLSRDWHDFRAKEVIEKIQSWAQGSSIGWQESWLSTSGEHRGGTAAGRGLQQTMPEWRNTLSDFLNNLEEEDLQVIQVPISLVVKLWGSRR